MAFPTVFPYLNQAARGWQNIVYYREPSSIGVIEVYEPILYTRTRDHIVAMIDYAIQDEGIKAVVLKLDTPGGYADAVEEIYYDLLKLRAKKPVVASVIGMALSGGFYICVAADYSYCVPTAMVGNVGVLGFPPPKFRPSEEIVETGPLKQIGFSKIGFYKLVNEVMERFLDAVEKQRGDRLLISRTELSKGGIYSGVEAARLGLIDEVGSSITALRKAAELAGVSQYTVVRLNDVVEPPPPPWWWFSSESTVRDVRSIKDLEDLKPPPTLYYIYVPPSLEGDVEGFYSPPEGLAVMQGYSDLELKSESGILYVDYSHENAFSPEEISTLIFEVSSRRWAIRFLENFQELPGEISKPSSLVIISPTTPFTNDEIQLAKQFVEQGGKLLLIYEPARASPTAINSLAVEFEIVFSGGFLYNLKENKFNYRNIYVADFKEATAITAGLKKLILFTSTAAFSRGNEAAFVDNETYLSESQASIKYSPIVFNQELGVVAVGDQTFLEQPYSSFEDNYQLIVNIAEYLTSKS